jgi:hypothetical protein
MTRYSQWVACFSYTGTEIYELCKKTGKLPALIFTSNKKSDINCKLYGLCDVVIPCDPGTGITYLRSCLLVEKLTVLITGMPKFDEHNQFWQVIISYLEHKNNAILSLHGWKYILPDLFLNSIPKVRVVNGHPGNIIKYPDLRGQDPQQKVIDNPEKYDIVGCVLHEVRAGEAVDSGEILAFRAQYLNRIDSLPLYFANTQLKLWSEFIDWELL